MAAAARQGLPVLYAGGHGTGHWGDLVRAALAAEGIGLLRPPDPSADTGFDVALVEPDAERTFVTALGAESVSGPGGWDAIAAGPGDVVYVSGYGLVAPGSGPDLGRWAAALPPTVLLFVDPGPLVVQIPPEVLDPVLARCDWLSCNAREAALLTGVTAHEAAPLLLARATRANVIVRLGPDGCLLATRAPGSQPTRAQDASDRPGPSSLDAAPTPNVRPDRAQDAPSAPVHVPAPAVHAVDTTGAGDAHAGVFLAALADGLSPAEAVRRANAAAALAVTRPGPATSPTRAELDAWRN
jgi:sugar/nucleoside kinase (ribokinase family)